LSSFSRSPISSADDGLANGEGDNARVESYGVVWQESERAPVAGKLEIDSAHLRLEGNDSNHLSARTVALSELVGVRVGRESGERLDGRPTLLLDLSSGGTIRIAALAQAGIVAEIAERLVGLEPRMRAAG
jgi:hypothetical protein